MRGISKRTQLAYLAALFTLVVGVLSLINPLLMVRLVGLEVVEPRGLSTMRSTFGLLYVSVAVALVWGLVTRPKGKPWVLAASSFWLVTALGRLLSLLLIDFAITPLNLVLVGVELTAGLLALFAGLEKPKDRVDLELEEDEEYVSRTQ